MTEEIPREVRMRPKIMSDFIAGRTLLAARDNYGNESVQSD